MLSKVEQKRATNQAQRDLVEKLRLEDTLEREIRSLFRRVRDDFRVHVAASGSVPSSSSYVPAWQTILNNHYKRVQTSFSGTVMAFNNKCWTDIETKQQEEEEDDTLEALLALALLQWRNERAIEQAEYIVRTTERNMHQSLSEARNALLDSGEALTNRNLATTGAAVLARKLLGRIEGIKTLETQAPAEVTKFFEAQAMSGIAPTVAPIDPISEILRPQEPTQRVIKTWRTIGDSKVRESHNAANFQTVPIDEPFIVQGEQLMFPSDSSLGASLNNIINCRCSVIYATVTEEAA